MYIIKELLNTDFKNLHRDKYFSYLTEKERYYETMNIMNTLKVLFNILFNRKVSKGKEMEIVFQWRRYIEWRDLTSEEKLSAKRILLIPIIAYFIVGMLNQYFSLLVLFLIGYITYRKFVKGRIVKK